MELLENTAAFATSMVVYESLPPSLEARPLRCYYGFALYATRLDKGGQLRLAKLRDRATVVVNADRVSVLSRRESLNGLEITVKEGSTLRVLVESLGRINFGHGMDDTRKGILEEITLNGKVLKGWNVSCLEFHNMDPADVIPHEWIPVPASISRTSLPMFYKGAWMIPPGGVADSYVFTAGWGRGVIWVNGHNLGRFSEMETPQRTLYCPRVFLREGVNTLVIFELDPQHDSSRTVEFVSNPVWSKPRLTSELNVEDRQPVGVTAEA